MITGEAFWTVAQREYAADRSWHVEQAGKPFFSTVFNETLDDFLADNPDRRGDVIGYYLLAWYELYEPHELPNGDPTMEREFSEECDRFDGHLQALANGKPAKTEKSAGDKWASPGRLVCTWPDLDLTARAVLFVMAAHGRDDGSNCFVSQATIAEYLGLSQVETVRRAWRRLEKAGAIKQTAKATQQKPPTYRINRGPRVV
ncbi:MAG: helix-turn-helix domain-containing protein [Actinomycetota bacterium]